MKNPKWSKEEDDILSQNIHLTIYELTLLLGRSDGSIRSRKYRLGLKSNKFPCTIQKSKD